MLANQNKKFEPTVCIKQNELRSHINFQTCSLEFKIFPKSHPEVTLIPATSNLNAFCQVGVQLLSSLEFQVYWKQYVVCMITISKERTGMVDLENLPRIQGKFPLFHWILTWSNIISPFLPRESKINRKVSLRIFTDTCKLFSLVKSECDSAEPGGVSSSY